MAPSSSPVSFTVRHRDPELVVPAKPVPYEQKQLSDVDDQEALRYQIPFIMFYDSNSNPCMEGEDQVKIIRAALAEALVYYYPLAGRLKEGPDGKLLVDCSGEGVLFLEADADTTLELLGDTIQPPCPYLDQLLYNVPGSAGIVGCPLLLIQVTRLMCGGFVFAIRWSHIIADAVGMFKFLNTIAEMVPGATKPSFLPVWQRELLNARDPPRPTYEHHEFDEVNDADYGTMNDDTIIVHKSFFFGPKEMSSIRKYLPPHLRASSSFLVLTACLWKCRTIAMQLDPNEIVRVSYMVSASGKEGLKLPAGYYGNAFTFPVALSESGLLCKNPLEYGLELVKEIKNRLSEEYTRSAIDLLVIKGKKQYRTVRDFVIADTTRVPFGEIDLGWGKPVYGGPAGAIKDVSFFAKFKNGKGDDGIVVQVSLPWQIMERFQKELAKMAGNSSNDQFCRNATEVTRSKL
ncbi:methanol O-anthraniloyltransferase-like [Populus alba x Populus x berolinensis]|nr:methanol O-anthraniloyltransferase-like [Populus alba x Populus x berolinensis]